MAERVVAWLNGSSEKPIPNDDKRTDVFQGLLLVPGNRVYYMDESLTESEIFDAEFIAIGSGRELALGAMAMGAAAK